MSTALLCSKTRAICPSDHGIAELSLRFQFGNAVFMCSGIGGLSGFLGLSRPPDFAMYTSLTSSRCTCI